MEMAFERTTLITITIVRRIRRRCALTGILLSLTRIFVIYRDVLLYRRLMTGPRPGHVYFRYLVLFYRPLDSAIFRYRKYLRRGLVFSVVIVKNN